MMHFHRLSPVAKTSPHIFLPYLFSTQWVAFVQSQTTFYSPILVSFPAVARTVNKLYILSGVSGKEPFIRIPQFIRLDLAIPWTSTAPAWTKLADGLLQYHFPATFSSDEQTLFVFQIQGTRAPLAYDVQSNTWRSIGGFQNESNEGVGAVTDPNTGLIYLAGESPDVYKPSMLNMFDPIIHATRTVQLPNPNDAFSVRVNYGNVWSKHLNSILYWGGTTTVVGVLHSPVTNLVTQLLTDGMIWSTMAIKGPAPTGKYGHCMATNDEGTKVAIYGGRLLSGAITGELWMLDVVALSWTQGISGSPRAGAACAIAGDQFLVWGGLVDQEGEASGDVLIYNLESSKYMEDYTPPTFYKDLKSPPPLTRTTAIWPKMTFSVNVDKDQTLTTNDQPLIEKDRSRSTIPIGASIGGAVCGLVLLSATAAYFISRRRRRLKQPQKSLDVEDTNLRGIGGWIRRFERGRQRRREGSGKSLKKDLQDSDEDDQLERTLQELQDQEKKLEHQKKELNQKRQLLVMQHRESNPSLPTDQKRGPTAFTDDKVEFIPLPPPGASPVPSSSSNSVSYSPENLSERRTVQAVSGPVDMYHRGSYIDDGPRRESELGQEMIEPIYGPSPTVNNAIPDLVYIPSPNVGMDWTKQQQANHPHALVDPFNSTTQQ